MIKELDIRNFQSHKRSILKFDPGVNVIIGETDAGKSALMNSLRLVIWNKPVGNSFCSHWGGNTRVGILTDQDQIIRKKGKVNEYILNDQSFKAFKTNVPEEISKVLNINEINFQRQFDGHFLIKETPGKVATHFNKIANLTVIDTATTNIKKEMNVTNSQIKHTEKDLKEKEKELRTYSYLEEFEIDIEQLEKLEKNRNLYSKNKSDLNILCDNITNINQEIEVENNIIKLDKKVTKILFNINLKGIINVKINNIQTLYDKITAINSDIENKSQLIKLDKKVNNLLQLYTKARQFEEAYNNLNNLITKCTTIQKKLFKTQENSKAKQKLFNKVFPNICPLCNTNLKKKL